jgi:hypothetical protein
VLFLRDYSIGWWGTTRDTWMGKGSYVKFALKEIFFLISSILARLWSLDSNFYMAV